MSCLRLVSWRPRELFPASLTDSAGQHQVPYINADSCILDMPLDAVFQPSVMCRVPAEFGQRKCPVGPAGRCPIGSVGSGAPHDIKATSDHLLQGDAS